MDPADIDIMMGTFTKSFGSCGGYIAANRRACEAVPALGCSSPPASVLAVGHLRLPASPVQAAECNQAARIEVLLLMPALSCVYAPMRADSCALVAFCISYCISPQTQGHSANEIVRRVCICGPFTPLGYLSAISMALPAEQHMLCALEPIISKQGASFCRGRGATERPRDVVCGGDTVNYLRRVAHGALLYDQHAHQEELGGEMHTSVQWDRSHPGTLCAAEM